MDIWDICEEITSKQDWYSKVFDQKMVSKWRIELPNKAGDDFDFAIKLLQASAQGSKILERCDWNDDDSMCNKCRLGLEDAVKADPEKFGLSVEEVSDPGFFEDDWDNVLHINSDYCKHPRCKCSSPHSSLENYIQYSAKDLIPSSLHGKCKSLIALMMREEPIDWHPGSNEQVRDLIHPSLYCYVKGKSILNKDSTKSSAGSSNTEETKISGTKTTRTRRVRVSPTPKDYEFAQQIIAQQAIISKPKEQRASGGILALMEAYEEEERAKAKANLPKSLDPDEPTRYQWLPSEFKVNAEGKVNVLSYINNLKADKYPEFIPLVESVFECFVPLLEKVMFKPIKGRQIQVIVKVGSTILTPKSPKYEGGSWHLEGMVYEHIAATAIHYVEVDGITPSFLEFRKPVLLLEEGLDYPQSDDKYTSHHYGIEPGTHHKGHMNRYLGLIKAIEGGSVVFPNVLQHRVKDFAFEKDAKSGNRVILAFFVIDPDHRIVSTADVTPQQKLFTREEANFHRERLMYHRKYYVNSLNQHVFEREFSLCEH